MYRIRVEIEVGDTKADCAGSHSFTVRTEPGPGFVADAVGLAIVEALGGVKDSLPRAVFRTVLARIVENAQRFDADLFDLNPGAKK